MEKNTMRYRTQERPRTRVVSRRRKIQALILSLLFSHLVACGSGVQVGRIGRPTTLSSGAPQNSCEREKWVELAPARVVAEGMVSGVMVDTYYRQVNEGFGVFEIDSNDPEDVEDLWADMNEPELEKEHMKSITPVDDAFMDTIYWSLGGLAGMFGGLGIAVAVQEESGEAAAVAGISGLVIGLVGVIGALASQPSGPDQVYADARRTLFIPEEDDVQSVERGVDRINIKQRTRCGGAYSEPTGAVKPVEKPAPAKPEVKSTPAAPQPYKQDIEVPTATDSATPTEETTTVSPSEPTSVPPTVEPKQEAQEITEPETKEKPTTQP
jgi:hypothetical protein